MGIPETDRKGGPASNLGFPEAGPDKVSPWETLEAGRYQPRRIRGSLRGRELGWTFVVPPGSGGTKTESGENGK